MYTLRIEQDTDISWLDSPREWDNLGTMVCWHRSYSLGDIQPKMGVGDYLFELLEKFHFYHLDDPCSEYWLDFIYDLENDSHEAIMRAWELLDSKIIYLPLYLFDHSGLSISTNASDFSVWDSAGWDWGRLGFIYVEKDKVREEFGWSRISSKRREMTYNILRQEVKTYDQYLTGDVWGYVIEDENGDVVDSCWGFYGYEYCRQEGEAQLEYHQKKHNEFLAVLQSIESRHMIERQSVVRG